MIDWSERCSACPGRFCVIPGDNLYPCAVVCIGQNPGKTEEARAARGDRGMVFIGDAGRESNEHYLPLAGLHRNESVAMTNTTKCHTEQDRKPSLREVAACSAHFLSRELELYNPDVVVMLGGTALSLVPDLSIQTHHGHVFKRPLFGKDRWIFVTQHPAAGLHDPARMADSIKDFEELRKVIRGTYEGPKDEYPDCDYRDLTGKHEEIERILRQGLNGPRIIAMDTEYHQEKKSPHKDPWCVTFTITPGTGYMIRVGDHDGLRILARYLPYYFVVLHNALADLDPLHEMGIDVEEPFDDTMQMAAAQQDLAQKLKVLAWRLAGMTMRDYDDVVVPFSRDAVLEWLIEAFDVSVETRGVKYIHKKRKFPKTEKQIAKLAQELISVFPIYGALAESVRDDGYVYFDVPEDADTELSKKIMHIYKHTAKPTPPESDPYDCWEAWEEQVLEAKTDDGAPKFAPEQVYAVTSRVGPLPKVSIQHVFDKEPQTAIRYACRDSDSTRRIHPVLQQYSHKYEGLVVPGDIDR